MIGLLGQEETGEFCSIISNSCLFVKPLVFQKSSNPSGFCKRETDLQEPLGFDALLRRVDPERAKGLQGTQPALHPKRFSLNC